MNCLSLSRCALSVCAVALLAGCGGSQETSSTIPASDLAQTGVAPEFWQPLRIGAVPPRHHHKYLGLKDLYVADPANTAVELLANGTYKKVGSISNGITFPAGDFLDKKGNLYVANATSSLPNIVEYAPGGTSPSFTYNASMFDPTGVRVDAAGNVYEADYHGGFVNEYAQGVNAVLHSCPVSLPAGVAVDASGDVFVDSLSSTRFTLIYEYIGGLIKRGHPYRCQPTTLGAAPVFGGGMALDNNNDLVVCDQYASAVYIIDPPYSSITRTLGSGYVDPYDVTLNKSNTLAFVTDLGLDEVFVYDYKTNTLVTTLGSGNGLAVPYSAVDGPNAVP